jgi:hypothetical protein
MDVGHGDNQDVRYWPYGLAYVWWTPELSPNVRFSNRTGLMFPK